MSTTYTDTEQDTRPRVVIAGGGFAGWWAARALKTLSTRDAHVTLIDSTGVITMIPSLPDVVAHTVSVDRIERNLLDMLPRNVELAVDTVERVDLGSQKVSGRSSEYPYDFLILATGSKPAFFGFAPAINNAYTLSSTADATRLRDEFSAYIKSHPGGRVVISGGGYTGLELADALSRAARRHGTTVSIVIVDKAPSILAMLTDSERESVRSYLRGRDVEIRGETTVESYAEGTVRLNDGSSFDDVFFCWSVGAEAAFQTFSGEVPVLRDGRIEVAPTLQVPDHPHVFAAGDAAGITSQGSVLRRSVNYSLMSERHAGKNVLRMLGGRSPVPFEPIDLGWVIPVGTASSGRIMTRIPIRGKLALRMHYFMCGYRNFSPRRFLAFVGHALRLPSDRPTVRTS